MTVVPISAAALAAALGLPAPTEQQRAVIEAPLTPALVVAGAGSGKTETMAARVVWLVANGFVQREEVLGLTFTRKAAGELAERIGQRLARIDWFAVRGLLPHVEEIVRSGALRDQSAAELPDLLDRLALRYGTAAEGAQRHPTDLLLRPRVATYNAFADAIVREHAARIGGDAEATMLGQSGSWLLARAVVLRSLDPRLSERDDALSSIIDAVQRLAAASLDNRAALPEVAEFGDAWAERIAPLLREGVQPGSPEKAHAAVSALSMIARLAEDYAAAKRAQGTLDFADQVAGALQIIETVPAVASELRQQYRVILLDEYQDTSVLQTRLLAAIFRDEAVMAVGDPHQSIYGWRGASADNLQAFPAAFANDASCGQYELTTSWRNATTVLQAANALLVPLQARPGQRPVSALQPRPGSIDGDVDVSWHETIAEEAAAVADWFEQERSEHTGDAPHTGAILFRAKKHMQTFAEALAQRGIPHRVLGLGGLLTTPEVTDVVAALRATNDPAAGSSLLRLLAGPRFAIGVADLAALHELAGVLARTDGAGVKLPDAVLARVRTSAGVDEQLSIIDALDVLTMLRQDSPLLRGFTDVGVGRLREAGAMLDRFRRASGMSIPERIRMIETELRLDIELAANESRGPARTAATQLRSFVDEVRAFLDTDERGTMASLLAWLSHAENTDELMPRPEPPEPGVVQLLTVHGAKGLEWDSVAVVRLVTDELPKAPRSTRGWLSLGGLPYPFRGDRAALPELHIPADADWKGARDSIDAFATANRALQLDEERRLAYVAVTRARSALLLSGSAWGGQTRPRKPSVFLNEMLAALGREEITGESALESAPAHDGSRVVQWPLDPLGARADRVHAAAALAAEAYGAPAPTADAELARLLAERADRLRSRRPSAPTRVPASSFKDFIADFGAASFAVARPMPERPYPQTRMGTDFHTWVEHYYERAGTGPALDDLETDTDSDRDDEPGSEQLPASEREAMLAVYRDNFLRSEWAGLAPEEVESEVNCTLELPDGSAHVLICKLDAVFRRADRSGRIEIVDWKTGHVPTSAAERESRLLQLALYRLAYHRARGVPLDQIDVALFYVAADVVLRPERLHSEAELAEMWAEARTASA